jgi:hypothetical protein
MVAIGKLALERPRDRLRLGGQSEVPWAGVIDEGPSGWWAFLRRRTLPSEGSGGGYPLVIYVVRGAEGRVDRVWSHIARVARKFRREVSAPWQAARSARSGVELGVGRSRSRSPLRRTTWGDFIR